MEVKKIRRQPMAHNESSEKEKIPGTMFDPTLGYGFRRSLFFFSFIAVVLLLVLLSRSHGSSSSFDLFLSSFAASEEGASSSVKPSEDKLLGGLLSPSFDEAACQSRYRSASYRPPSNHTPSPYLAARFRRYESLHQKCGPNTALYKEAVDQLKSNRSAAAPTECNYVVWVPSDGLGNRMISIASAFLYALLNDKVLLLHLSADMDDLFCEPFPNTSWVLPSDFPVRYSWTLESDHRYGSLLQKKMLRNDMDPANSSLPSFLYLHLVHSNHDFDKMFYCEEGQKLLRKFSWLLLRSNQYFAPAFFLIPEYEKELNLLFPEKTTLFHHLARYLFHPSNSVWGYMTRYYEAYLANTNAKLGIQIRVFGGAKFESHSKYIIDCALSKKLLPNVTLSDPSPPIIAGARPKSVLVTSLLGGYFEKLRNMYYEHATVTGEVVGVYQPSHEETQHTEKLNHNKKALAEIYLLSFSDSLITSAFSTFGYVAQGLGGLRPWLLVKPKDGELCLRSMSMEPCFHFPPSLDCQTREKVDFGTRVPYLRHCEDFSRGVRLFD